MCARNGGDGGLKGKGPHAEFFQAGLLHGLVECVGASDIWGVGHSGGEALTDHLVVDEYVADEDVAEETVIFVHLADVFDQGDSFTADQLGIFIRGFLPKGISLVDGFGGVDADVADWVESAVDGYVDGVAVDDAHDDGGFSLGVGRNAGGVT